jgi:hypothetical protein
LFPLHAVVDRRMFFALKSPEDGFQQSSGLRCQSIRTSISIKRKINAWNLNSRPHIKEANREDAAKGHHRKDQDAEFLIFRCR